MRNYRNRLTGRTRQGDSHADRTTLWLLLLVIAALVVALTFSDAHGGVLHSLIFP